LAPPPKQNYQTLSVLGEIHSVSGPEIKPAFEHAGTDSLDIREIAARQQSAATTR
jgi:hypothetical protein